MVTTALFNKDSQPSQTCSEGYTFSATALYRYKGVFLFSEPPPEGGLDLVTNRKGAI